MQLATDEIQQAIDRDRFPAVLTPKQAAELFQVSLATIYRWSSEERFSGSVRRGRPLRFWRDRMVEQFFSGDSGRSGLRPRHRQR